MDYERELSGKRVVVTGACGIYGRGFAGLFAREGAALCLTDRDGPSLEAALAEAGGAAGSFAHVADLGDAASMQALIDAVGARWGAPDIVVNNAGIYPSGFLLDIDVGEWDRIMGVNLRAPFVLTRGFARQMIEHRVPGAIVNISSGASTRLRRSVVPYCVSKTALDRLTKGFALELAEYGIRVNAVEPGFAAGSTSSPLSDEHVRRMTASVPLGRPGTTDDAGAAVLWLCSRAASFVTGTTLSANGGSSLGALEVFQDKKSAL